MNGERQDYTRIKDLLVEWAGWFHDKLGAGYPGQCAFATERVDSSNRSTESYVELPEIIHRLNREIEKMAPGFRRVLSLEYLDSRPQKTKAAVLGIPRQVFSQRLAWIYEHLTFTMFSEE